MLNWNLSQWKCYHFEIFSNMEEISTFWDWNKKFLIKLLTSVSLQISPSKRLKKNSLSLKSESCATLYLKAVSLYPFFLLQLGSLRGNVDPIWRRDGQQPSWHGRQNDHAFFDSFRWQRWCTCILVCFRVGSCITWFISSCEENNCKGEQIHKMTLEIVLDEQSCHFEWK